MAEKELSPMMQQYCDMKEKYKDYILMYRLGDFYEMFFEDAVTASKELDIVLTGRDCGLDERAPMCGVPYHAVDSYVARLVQKGYKVSICEQFKAPGTNDVTGREVVRMVTPGTITEPEILDESKNSYIVAVFDRGGKVCLCAVDVSTGDIFLNRAAPAADPALVALLGKYQPLEIYSPMTASGLDLIKQYSEHHPRCLITEASKRDNAAEAVEQQLGKTVGEIGFTPDSLEVEALGGLFCYLHETQLCSLSHVRNLTVLGSDTYMEIDMATWRNLEIVETMRQADKRGSLLGVLDKTETAMGARLLHQWLERPLLHSSRIVRRQDAVEDLYKNNMLRSQLRDALGEIKDVERLLTKVVYGSVNPHEVKSLGLSFAPLPSIRALLANSVFASAELKEIASSLDDLSDISERINATLVEEPPLAAKDGGIVRAGFSADVDELRLMLEDSRRILADLETREKEKTGISKLKVGYNKVFGYYIEVSNSFKDKVPDTYIRKQTLVNGERFITQELKEIEVKLLTAKDRVVELEYEIFADLRNYLFENLDRIKKTTALIARTDVCAALAECAVRNHYVRPIVDETDTVEIKDGRHPVVESVLKEERFVPNNAYLNCTDNRMALITGPNMAGKSTYMRSIALIVLMAQIGSYVPASYARIGVVDKIFTRVGASDDLASGQSTFMLEMSEVAYILKNATKRSLLIFDEIGRGTSTFDGMSIARAVLEYVAEKIKAKTLFATHYHELIALENTVEGLKNYNVAAKKRGNSVTFLRKIVEGGTDDSYGIDVARLAGVPDEVIKNAEAVLAELEQGKVHYAPLPKDEEPQISLTSAIGDEILETLKSTDASVLTPIEAMNLLYKLSNQAKEI